MSSTSSRFSMRSAAMLALLAAMAFAFTAFWSGSASGEVAPLDPAAAEASLFALTDGQARLSYDRATGFANFVSMPADAPLRMSAATSASAQADAFWRQYGSLFGIADADTQLIMTETRDDHFGNTRVAYRQVHNGVDVFGGILYVHLNGDGAITAANGVAVDTAAVDTTPVLAAADAGAIAGRAAALTAFSEGQSVAPAGVVESSLLVYHTGLLQGIAGEARLAYQMVVSNGANINDTVYVDAHKGNVLNQYTNIHDTLTRRIYNGGYNPALLVWEEGDPYPFVGADDVEINQLHDFTEQSYNMFATLSAGTFLSYDGNSAMMETVLNDPGINCPNANWNGVSTNYCTGTTGDDTVGHEWGHAYDQGTGSLIYQWQPGALDESLADIWGEVLDLLNGTGLDTPGGPRAANACSVFGGNLPVTTEFVVNAPGNVAGPYVVGIPQFGPVPPPNISITGDVVIADDGTGEVTDGCEPFVNGAAIAGNVAFIDRGSCPFTQKVANAQAAGAIAAIIANINPGEGAIPMGGNDATITIPSVMVSFEDGQLLRAEVPALNVSMDLFGGGGATDNTYRWLAGEDDPAFGGAIRDMWNPRCKGDPGKVSDSDEYECTTFDSGGVHINSGVPNHHFALLVDGGTYNGVTVPAIGLEKTSHIVWYNEFNFNTPTTDFPQWADGFAASCQALIGVDLPTISVATPTTGPSGIVISQADCDAVALASEAVEFYLDPTEQCDFQPLLDPNAPSLCLGDETIVYSENFDSDPSWALSNLGVFAEYSPRDWEYQAALPDGRTGGYFGIDSVEIGDCVPGSDDQSGVMFLDSPAFTVPTLGAGENIFVTADHWVATENGWDGGIVEFRVNGGAWAQVPAAAFVFNGYNAGMQTAAAGNTNPLAGLTGFTGTNGGEVTGSWGQSQIDITGVAAAGDTVELRFSLGVDGCNGAVGWYVDAVEVVACAAPQPADISVDPGQVTTYQLPEESIDGLVKIMNNGDEKLMWALYTGTMLEQEQSGINGIFNAYDPNIDEGGLASADFSLLTETTLTSIVTPGFVNGNSAANDELIEVATQIDWYIYPDAGGVPAGNPSDGANAHVWTYSSAPTGAGVDLSDDVISLDLAAAGATGTLPAGQYWLVVVPHIDVVTNGDSIWGWFAADGTGTANAHLNDINGGFFGLPADVWNDFAALVEFTDLAYAIEGTSTVCDVPADVPWLTVAPMSGSIEAGMMEQLMLTFDSTGYDLGTYDANLCILSNDGDQPLIELPAQMNVVSDPTDVSLTDITNLDARTAWVPAAAVAIFVGVLGAMMFRRRDENA